MDSGSLGTSELSVIIIRVCITALPIRRVLTVHETVFGGKLI